jgi:hypothetical protein
MILPRRILLSVGLYPAAILRCNFHSSSHNANSLNTFWRWLSRVGSKTTLGSAGTMFKICEKQAYLPFWQKTAKLGDDFRSKHMLLVVHVWMIHKRLQREGKPGLLVQEALFDALWDDSSNRIHSKGIPEISLNKYLKDVQSYSFRTCIELDQALVLLTKPVEVLNEKKLLDIKEGNEKGENIPPMSDADMQGMLFKNTEEAVLDSIAGAVWRGLYLRDENVDEGLVMAVARYIRSQQLALQDQTLLSFETMKEGNFMFGDPAKYFKERNSGK